VIRPVSVASTLLLVKAAFEIKPSIQLQVSRASILFTCILSSKKHTPFIDIKQPLSGWCLDMQPAHLQGRVALLRDAARTTPHYI
jgi:hypothetical protein